ncbi:hypothetical protein HHX47_DHR3001198 [Lentinula edodes]|nr:hypothetical protein HHX47_DHR3001198 [Lentinula edodes]
MDTFTTRFFIPRILSQLPCIYCIQSSTTDSGPQHLHLLARRGLLPSPAHHALLLTFIIFFAAIVFPLLCLYCLRLYARRRRTNERESLEASLRRRLEVQRDIDRLEREFLVPGSMAEPLPPYLPRPPAYSLETNSVNSSRMEQTVSPAEIKVAPPLPVLSRQRSATFLQSLEYPGNDRNLIIARTSSSA